MKKYKLLILLLAFTMLMTGCAVYSKGAPKSKDGKIVLRAGVTTERGGNYVTGLEKFKELVEERSKGDIEIQIYPSSQLGNERDLVEGVAVGTIEMCVSSTGPLANFSKDFQVFDLPYICSDLERTYDFMDGEYGREILDTLTEKGIYGLGFWENGYRHITNSKKPINTPEDVKNLKIRVMENAVHIDSFKEWGANPTAMSWAEVFTSLQQGTIDAQENPIVIAYTNKLWEVQDYLSLTGHFYSPATMLINNDLLESLSDEHKKIILECEEEARHFERDFNQSLEKENLKEIADHGMAINEVDTSIWIEASQPIYKKYENVINPKYIKALLGKGE